MYQQNTLTLIRLRHPPWCGERVPTVPIAVCTVGGFGRGWKRKERKRRASRQALVGIRHSTLPQRRIRNRGPGKQTHFYIYIYIYRRDINGFMPFGDIPGRQNPRTMHGCATGLEQHSTRRRAA